MPRACRIVHIRDKLNGRTFATAPASRHDLVADIITRRLSILERSSSDLHPRGEAGTAGNDGEIGIADGGDEFFGFGPDFDEEKKRVLSRRIDTWVTELVMVHPGHQAPAAENTVARSGSSPCMSEIQGISGHLNPPPARNTEHNVVQSDVLATFGTERNERVSHAEKQEDDVDERIADELVQEQVSGYRMEAMAAAELQKAAEIDAEDVKNTYLEKQLGGKSRKIEEKKIRGKLVKVLRATKIKGVLRFLKSRKIGPELLERAWKVAMFNLHPDKKLGASRREEETAKQLIALRTRLAELKE